VEWDRASRVAADERFVLANKFDGGLLIAGADALHEAGNGGGVGHRSRFLGEIPTLLYGRFAARQQASSGRGFIPAQDAADNFSAALFALVFRGDGKKGSVSMSISVKRSFGGATWAS
jgi:hypothetical protein